MLRVPAAGGPTTVLTRPDRTAGELDHLWPELLPGGRAVLFTITALTGGLDAAQVVVQDLNSGRRTVLVRGGSQGHCVSSGNLVYAAAHALLVNTVVEPPIPEPVTIVLNWVAG